MRRFCRKLTRLRRMTRTDGHRRQLAVELEEGKEESVTEKYFKILKIVRRLCTELYN